MRASACLCECVFVFVVKYEFHFLVWTRVSGMRTRTQKVIMKMVRDKEDIYFC